jgi:azurin
MRRASVRPSAAASDLPDGFGRRRQLILAAPLLLLGCRQGTTPAPMKTVELHIQTDGDFLAFVPTELTCPTGAHVRLYFHHAGEHIPQEHNWVLVKPGMLDEVEKAGMEAGEASGWVPQHDPRVLAATSLCSPGGIAMVEFVAPAPGDYPFLCSFPGHGAEMQGVLHVTP